MENKLTALMNPISKPAFLEHYNTNTALLVHDLKESIAELTELPFLKSIDDLLDFWPKEIDSYLPGISDEVNSITTSKIQAKELFKQGRSLILNDADTVSPVLKEWVQGLIQDLGLSTMTYGRSLLYAVPKNHGTDAHFDQNINFVLQLHGTKKWWVAPNIHVQNPMTRHTIGAVTDPELSSYTAAMPDSFPEDDATEFTLKPGSCLFVPRGAWHRTEAMDEDTLALNFTLTAPTWVDLLTAALRGRLLQSEKWRGTADFVTDEKHYTQAIKNFDDLLSELAQDIPNWKAQDILQATEMDQFPDS